MIIDGHEAEKNDDAELDGYQEVDATLSLTRVNTITVALLPLLGGVTLLPYAIVWEFPSFPSGPGTLAIVIGFVGGIMLQEFLHKVGWWYWGGVAWRDVAFGVTWRSLSPYARTKIAMPASAYRRTVALPLLILCVLPTVAGVALNLPVLIWYALAMLVASGGDMATLWSMRSMDDELLVRDHPERAGCLVLVKEG